MPWEDRDLMTNRTEFVKLALNIRGGASDMSFTELCRGFGISTKTGYKWLKRFNSEGAAGLGDRSRAPNYHPNQTNKDVEQVVLKLRDHHPAWGGRKLRAYLLRSQEIKERDVPSASTITEILRRGGRLNDSVNKGATPLQRFERAYPNELWQMDFKGHFPLKQGGRCHPLTITDDHSRYNICLKACTNETRETVQECIRYVFKQFGLPEQILSDNGAAWSCQKRRYACSSFEAWLIRLGVDPIHGRPYHPQTQGKEERFHRTLDVEVLKTRSVWESIKQCDSAFNDWRIVYNELRPHESLNDDVPISRYTPSVRRYRSKDETRNMTEHYQESDQTRKVDRSGYFYFKSKVYYAGMGLVGERVAIRQIGESRATVSYGWKTLGEIDLNAPKETISHIKKFRSKEASKT